MSLLNSISDYLSVESWPIYHSNDLVSPNSIIFPCNQIQSQIHFVVRQQHVEISLYPRVTRLKLSPIKCSAL